MGVFSHIYKRPRPNQSWDEDRVVTHHEEETWLQLFIDLIFVAFFMTLGKGIAYCENYDGEKESEILGAAALLFVMVFGLRYDIDMYANRFHSRDLVTRILYFTYTCGVVIISLHIYKTGSSDACPFLGMRAKAELVGFIIAYFSIVCLNAIAIYNNPYTQPQLGLEFFFGVMYLLLSIIVVGPIPEEKLFNYFRVTVPLNYIFRNECLGQFIRPSFNKYLGPYLFINGHGPLELKRDVIPLNYHVHQVRLVMFVMIATGEGMIQIIYPSLPSDESYIDRIYMFVIACVVILFTLAMLYADAVVRNPHHSDHALKRDEKYAGVIWTFGHVILGYFMFLTGITIEMAIVKVYANDPISHSYDTLLGICIGSATLCMTLMRATHKGLVTQNDDEITDGMSWQKSLRRKINYSFRVSFSIIHFILAYLEYTAPGIESDDPTEADDTHFSELNNGISASAESSTDDTINYHNVRQQDAFFYYHAALLAFSLLVEVAASFLCKKKDLRATVARKHTVTTAISMDNENPLHETSSQSKNDVTSSSRPTVTFVDAPDNDKL